MGQARRAAVALPHPIRLARALHVLAGVARRALNPARAPRTLLNRRVETGRGIRFRLSLVAVKHLARARQGKVNDVDARHLDRRAPPPTGVQSRARRPSGADHDRAHLVAPGNRDGTIDNEFGAMSLPLSAWEADVDRRLDLIIERTREAKSKQHPAAVTGFLTRLSATPLGLYFAAHQHAVNVEVTDVTGPPGPVSLFGARVLAILPIVGPVGNMGPVLCAFSYAGQLFLVVTADAHSFPDLDVLMAGMEADGRALLGADH